MRSTGFQETHIHSLITRKKNTYEFNVNNFHRNYQIQLRKNSNKKIFTTEGVKRDDLPTSTNLKDHTKNNRVCQ
jgi:hypothetical protein